MTPAFLKRADALIEGSRALLSQEAVSSLGHSEVGIVYEFYQKPSKVYFYKLVFSTLHLQSN